MHNSEGFVSFEAGAARKTKIRLDERDKDHLNTGKC